MSLTNFQESILVLSALKNNMENDLRVIKRYIKDDDLKFSLHIKMLIDIDSFSNEWKRLNKYAATCLVSYDHISQRILKLALARDVLGNLLATLKAQTV